MARALMLTILSAFGCLPHRKGAVRLHRHGAHCLPALSIGLASYLAVLEGLWLTTKRPVYLDLFRHWLKPFSLVFGMGVVSGIVMLYQFSTNWGAFADKAGPVNGPLMGYEVLSVFFFEGGFLGACG